MTKRLHCELTNPGKHPRVHPHMMDPFMRANVAHPQMYGGMILRTGRVAYDLMVANKLSVSTFSRSLPNDAQVTAMSDRAVRAHEHANINKPYLPYGDGEDERAGYLTPASMRSVYIRAQRGILRTIHGYAIAALGAPENGPADPAEERVFMASKLLRPENWAAALLLQKIWHTADTAAHGRPIADATAAMHRAFSSRPRNMNERDALSAEVTRLARTAFDGLIIPALEPLKPEATALLGSPAGEDAIDGFTFDAIHEGAEEFTDEYIAHVRQLGRQTADQLVMDEDYL